MLTLLILLDPDWNWTGDFPWPFWCIRKLATLRIDPLRTGRVGKSVGIVNVLQIFFSGKLTPPYSRNPQLGFPLLSCDFKQSSYWKNPVGVRTTPILTWSYDRRESNHGRGAFSVWSDNLSSFLSHGILIWLSCLQYYCMLRYQANWGDLRFLELWTWVATVSAAISHRNSPACPTGCTVFTCKTIVCPPRFRPNMDPCRDSMSYF